jgi:peptidoglycan/LPS O-acetylase OafA/YrhL
VRELETITLAVLGVAVCDWAFMGKLGAMSTDIDYRYWPLTWPRLATLVVAATTAAVSALFLTPGDMPLWPFLVWVLVFGLWIFVAVDEIARQRAIGYRIPPRYSDPDD